jgi:hypothetical protein
MVSVIDSSVRGCGLHPGRVKKLQETKHGFAAFVLSKQE